MTLEINRIDTGVRLPALQFTMDLKEIINRHKSLNLSIETLLDNYRKLQQETKLNVPGFKIEKWYAWIDEQARSLNIRFGEGGDPQLIIREVEA
jgi:hypothetical protein